MLSRRGLFYPIREADPTQRVAEQSRPQESFPTTLASVLDNPLGYHHHVSGLCS